MAIYQGNRRAGQLDPTIQAIREAHVLREDAHVAHWPTPGAQERWAAERAEWEAGEAMICSTSELFHDCMAAGLEKLADRFVYANDPTDSRYWLIPGREGGTLLEVEWRGTDWWIVGTERKAPGAA